MELLPSLTLQTPHLVPDLLAPGLRLIFCGTAPSKASAAAHAYYAKPGNRFWPTLHTIGLTPCLWAPHQYPQLLNLGIGLTDLCKTHAGTDAELPENAFDLAAFTQKIQQYQPRLIAFTSKNAAQAYLGHRVNYGLQTETLGSSQLYVLPSPSGLATRYFDIRHWQALAEHHNQPS